MQLLTACVSLAATFAAVASAGFPEAGIVCPTGNYRLFPLKDSVNTFLKGTYSDAEKMCAQIGHKLASDITCIKGNTNVNLSVMDQIWVAKDADSSVFSDSKIDASSQCKLWSVTNKVVSFDQCQLRKYALCQGISSLDTPHSYVQDDEKFPYTQIFGAEVDNEEVLGVEAYYILCGVLGVVLIGFVATAAIWRSGYVNNRYSFRRMAANEAQDVEKPTKSHTVQSGIGSDVPQGYVKASATKETIA